MKTYGLIGKTLSHSFSKGYFGKKFEKEGINAEYKNFELSDVSLIKDLVIKEELSGLNVTIPYKESIIPFLDDLSEEAREIGAVNTIQFKEGKLIGHNTDILGFRDSIKPFLKSSHTRALILGKGGASKAVSHVLKKIGLDILFASRSPKKQDELSYDQINNEVIKFHQLIVNCTPLGTFPNVDEKPSLPYNALTEEHFLYDLVYNPAETAFLKEGKKKSTLYKNGYDMLVIQAEKAWEIWNS